jgi:N-acyl homoserine lactone hydrolase
MTPPPTPAADASDRVVCLTLGHEYCPRSLSLRDGGAELLRLPVIGVLVHDAAGWTLLDTGLSPTMRDPDRAAALYRSRNPEFPAAEDPLLAALAACGLTVADVSTVAVSHLHVDHSGGLGHFGGPGGPPVLIQSRELAFAGAPAAAAQGYVAADWDGHDLAWRPLDGDGPISPAVDAVSTPGHTPGHMSYRVRTPAGPWLLAMDAIDLQEGIDLDVEIGSSARPEDAPLRRASHDRLRALAAEEGARLIPGHCPVTWPTMPGPPAGLTA